MINIQAHPSTQSITTRHLLPLALFVITFVPMLCSALTYRPITLDQAVRHSELIIFGTVIKQEGLERAGRLFTRSTLRVHQSIKGTSSTEIVVEQVGGERGGIKTVISGAPTLQLSQQWVLFLRAAPAPREKQPEENTWVITGGEHGATQITRRSRDGELIVKRDRQVQPVIKLRPRLMKVKGLAQVPPTEQVKTVDRATAPSSTPEPSSDTSSVSDAVSLDTYLETLKASVTRSQAPLHPTH